MWKTITSEEYHGNYRTYLSSSDLRRILRSPAHYRAPNPPTTQAQEIGTLVHERILEPDLWEARRRPSARIDRRTKEGKALAEWQSSQEESLGLKFIPEDLYNTIEAIADSVHASVGSTGLLTGGVGELSGFCNINDVNIRVRPDYLKDDVIVDLKTCQDARPEAFVRSIFQYGYDVQAALYETAAWTIDGKQREFIWIAVEKEPPYGVCIYRASSDVIARGQVAYEKAIEIYKTCSALDVWPGYSTEIHSVKVPRYLENP